MIRFPNESAEYRAARNSLLAAERELRASVEAIAAMRRKLPLGGALNEDYVFDGATRPVRISELFEGDKDTLILYGFMYGPKMAEPCPLCTSFLDGLDRAAVHVTRRVNLAVVARSPIARILELAAARGWTNLRFLSSESSRFNADYAAETPEGRQLPALNVFVRRGDAVHHFYNAEMLYANRDPGQDSRHIDLIWPLWNLLDLTPEGRGSDWYPKLAYE